MIELTQSKHHWDLNTLRWDLLDPAAVDPEMLPVIKTAALVEANSADYADYLCGVFTGDVAFQRAAREWASEERQHGEALGRWAQLVDPTFDFERSLADFAAGYRVPVHATESVRGSRGRELVARCIVEVGTSSFYSSLMDATREPVLKEICRRIAGDEIRHYRLFLTHFERYQRTEALSRWDRLRVALTRFNEASDDELAYAYYAANRPPEPYDLRRHSQAYIKRAYAYYRPTHLQRALRLMQQAVGLGGVGFLSRPLSGMLYLFLRRQFRKWSREPAAQTAAAAKSANSRELCT